MCTSAYEKHYQLKLWVMTTTRTSEMFVVVIRRKKHHQRKLQTIKTIFSTNVRKHIWVCIATCNIWVGNCTRLVVVLVCVCGQKLCNIAVKVSPYPSVKVSV